MMWILTPAGNDMSTPASPIKDSEQMEKARYLSSLKREAKHGIQIEEYEKSNQGEKYLVGFEDLSESQRGLLISKNYGTKPKRQVVKGNPMAQTKKMGLPEEKGEVEAGNVHLGTRKENSKAGFLKGKNQLEMGQRVRKLASKKNKVSFGKC